MRDIRQVLLVDDNDDHNFLHTHVVRSMYPAAEVYAFEHARDALNYLLAADRPPVDLILVDVNMPVMNGFDFVQACAEHGIGTERDGTIVMISTSDNPMDVARARGLALVAAYLCKPLDQQHLIEALGAVT